MRTGVFLFGGVEMDDAGGGPPAPTDRRSTQEEMWRATEQLLELGVAGEGLGYDIFWLTEHHFQHEGYEVVPNGILLRPRLAAAHRSGSGSARCSTSSPSGTRCAWPRTSPTLHNISGGRGHLRRRPRHRAPRGVQPLGTGVSIGSCDNPEGRRRTTAQPARCSRSRWRSSSWRLRPTRRSRSSGKHYDVPAARHPRPRRLRRRPDARPPAAASRTRSGRPITQPADARVRARRRATAPCSGNQHYAFIKRWWERYAELYAERTTARELGARREADAGARRPHRGHPRAGAGDRRAPATTSSGSSSAPTAGAGATWGPTASRRRPG